MNSSESRSEREIELEQSVERLEKERAKVLELLEAIKEDLDRQADVAHHRVAELEAELKEAKTASRLFILPLLAGVLIAIGGGILASFLG
ncbi:hypothetical protein [Hasllibacter sp. MH4015]|uniref:hypothetical protein n=1 Tax=Hasllibacter sp. MH4015 TaxID=2854029 RepID=UPI001CD23B5A|nr:hypothetical protein [Hasllibacter sp. MH4015]